MSAQSSVDKKARPRPNRRRAGALLRKIAEDARADELRYWPIEYTEKLVKAGLGPILHRLAGPDAPSPVADLLLSADLTAQVLLEKMSDATEEILRAAGPAACEIVLLKGTAAAQAHYPEPHLRLMGDIDLLAPVHIFERLHAILPSLGYVQNSDLPAQFFEVHHHTMPFFHPKKQIWVELHRGLLPGSWSCASAPCFVTEAVLRNTVPMTFRGIATRRLSDALHLIYTCTHWAGSFNLKRGLLPLADVIYLLTRGQPLDWDVVPKQVPAGLPGRSLGLSLGYLASHSAIRLTNPAQAFVDEQIALIGYPNTRLLWWLLDSHLVGQRSGRFMTEWNVGNVWESLLLQEHAPTMNLIRLPFILLFPPNRPDRFNLTLAAKRFRSMLRPSDN